VNEHFFSDGSASKPLRIASINIGPGGLGSHLHSLNDWGEAEDIAIIHVQEARVRKYALKGLRKAIKVVMPHYRLYIHCSDPQRDRTRYTTEGDEVTSGEHWNNRPYSPNTAVATLIRKELVQYVKPLSPTSRKNSALTGRMLALHIKLPDCKQPIISVNCWMPHQGCGTPERLAAYDELTQRLQTWTKEFREENRSTPIILHGDFNATLHGKRNDTSSLLLQHLCVEADLTPNQGDDHPTWVSFSDPTIAYKIDHCLHTRGVAFQEDTRLDDKLLCTSDHGALTSTLSTDHGTWAPSTPIPLSTKVVVDMENFHETAPIWAKTVDERLSSSPPSSLLQAEELMLHTAKDIAGTRIVRRGGKRQVVKDPEQDTLRETTLIARRITHALMKGAPLPDWWTRHRLLLAADMPPEADSLPETISSDAEASETLRVVRIELGRRKRTLDNYIKGKEKERLKANINKKRKGLGTQKGSIQRAMGKEAMRAEMIALKSQHPDSLIIRITPNYEPTPSTIQDKFKAENLPCELRTTNDNSLAAYVFLHRIDLSRAIRIANSERWPIRRLETTCDIACSPSDLLSSVEAQLGDEGRSSRARCATCHSSHLCSLSSKEPAGTEDRTIVTYCHQCTTLTEIEIPPANCEAIKDWPEEVFTGFRTLPQDPQFRLRGSITMDELKYTIRHLALNKAPGPIGQLPAEVWRQAPDSILHILLDTVNSALEGNALPDHWKGGRISFLLKKMEPLLLKNWRPITLLELSYKIYSVILTKRLGRIAEAYQVYDESQEGFRKGRSTRRQFERIKQILYSQQRQRKKVYVTYIDFSNAFNSLDIEATLLALQKIGFPDVDLIRELYKDVWYQADTPHGLTAKIPLTRGSRQGDPASPSIFNLVMNICLRMMSLSGRGVITPAGKHNSAAFADDKALITNNPSDMDFLLNKVLAPFCKFTSMQVNIAKTEISAIDYQTGRGLPTDMIRYQGELLTHLPPNKPFKYLGIGLRLDLKFDEAIKDVLDRTSEAVDWLQRGSIFSPDQLDMLFNSCIVPLFRYSAPLLPWNANQLDALDKIWLRAQTHIYHLARNSPRAPIFLSTAHGGLGSPTSVEFLLKELTIHIHQCTQRDDELSQLLLHATKDEVIQSGHTSLGEAFQSTNQGNTVVENHDNRSPVWRLQHMVHKLGAIRYDDWWQTIDQPNDMTPDFLPKVVKETLDRLNPSRVPFPLDKDENFLVDHLNQGRALLRILTAHGITRIHHLLEPQSTRFRTLQALLPTSTNLPRWTKGYKWIQTLVQMHPSTPPLLQQRIEDNMLVFSTLTQGAPIEQRSSSQDKHKARTYDLDPQLWEPVSLSFTDAHLYQLEGDPLLGQPYTKWFPKSPRKQHIGVIAAFCRTDNPPRWKIVYDDGDAEDVTADDLSTTLQPLAVTTKFAPSLKSVAVREVMQGYAQWWADRWRQLLPLKILQQNAFHKVQGATLLLHGGPNNQWGTPANRKGIWQEHVYQVNTVPEEDGTLKVCKLAIQPDTTWAPDLNTPQQYLLTTNDLGPIRHLTLTDDLTLTTDSWQRAIEWEEQLQAADPSQGLVSTHSRLARGTTGIRPPRGRGNLITAYFASESTYALPGDWTTSTSAAATSIPEFRGQKARGHITSDWTNMTHQWETIGTRDYQDQYQISTRSGTTTVWKKHSVPQDTPMKPTCLYASKPMKRIRKDLLVYTPGVPLDNRRWTYLRDRCRNEAKGSEIALLDALHAVYLPEEDGKGTEHPMFPHWWVTSKAKEQIQADALYGVPPLYEDPGFQHYEHTDKEDSISIALGREPLPIGTPAVIWEPTNISPTTWRLWTQRFSKFILITPAKNTPPHLADLLRKEGGRQIAEITSGERAGLSHTSWAQGRLEPLCISHKLVVWTCGRHTHPPPYTQWRCPDDTSEPHLRLYAIWPPTSQCPLGWNSFWKGDQLHKYAQCTGILACTDGSCKKVEDSIEMGAGIAYRVGDTPPNAITTHNVIAGSPPNAFIAECIALLTCVTDTPKDTPLTVGIDNASLIFDTERCSFETMWKDLEHHEYKGLLTAVISALQERTATTTLVKVKAHAGQYLNEEADRLANSGASPNARPYPHETMYSADRASPLQVELWQGPDEDPKRITMQQAIKHLTAAHKLLRRSQMMETSPIFTTELTDTSVGRDIKAICLTDPKMSKWVVRDQLLWQTRRTPCLAWMRTWQPCISTLCRLCNTALENVAHIQLCCPTLHDAKTKAHNDCWKVIWEILLPELQRLKYTTYLETTLGNIPDFPCDITDNSNRRPDAVLIRCIPDEELPEGARNNRIIFLDFARTSGNTVTRLDIALRSKTEEQYGTLISDLRGLLPEKWTLDLHILNGSYAAALHVQHWRQSLRDIGIPSPTIDKVLKATMTQLCKSYSDIERTRKVGLKSVLTDQTSPTQAGNPPTWAGTGTAQ
jgi:endonuclease/exonuclease/phosphatase family metal-dependent hydrolase